MITLVLGGVRSGKSALAERLLAHGPARYVAPGPVPDPHDPADDEWAERVALHRRRRPASWTTLETGDVAAVLGADGPPVLVDCLGTWLTRVVDDAAVWEERERGREVVAAARADLVTALRQARCDVVLVSNEVGLGVVPATPSGRFFRDELGRLNTAVAAVADEVLLVVAGRVLDLSKTPGIDVFVTARSAR
ncbi:bifunctional adenosylcobinamide kinase/adenosylcobinamide-phosphate guanylyltransferase [Mobilicoccus massiliensis]|uniref:bifunctional adenosylcobinamide kinase/adenosylcobinamide-phosphate guanylyltransferase n=1 Tax=Mobilicoccus massiliensis TaxID=1522310 RepID=UPI00058CC9E4|nr:bifunctional adenosylcobinamide kinase/adenosylcobinamide-phosphate guanylyltransferase [Mobilicoccus massiliensis]